jgi:predicted methyltransferase
LPALLALLALPALASGASGAAVAVANKDDKDDRGAQDEEHGGAGHGRAFRDAERWANVFNDPTRDDWQMPLQVVELLGISPGQQVVDLGVGTGYFTNMLCAAVGERGKVYAVDIEQTMLDYVREHVNESCADVVVPVLAAPDDPRLPEGEVDVVLVVNTWHHVGKRIAYLKHLERALKPDGRVALIDWRAGDLPMGPPPEERLAKKLAIAEFEKAGWAFDSESVMLPYQYFLVFERPR